jgi:hypothetical protein
MSKVIEVLSPVGIRRTERRPLAARPQSLAGRVIGLMDNNKPGARQLLEGIKDELAHRGVQTFFYRRKAHPSGPSPYVEEVAARSDAVVGALGD